MVIDQSLLRAPSLPTVTLITQIIATRKTRVAQPIELFVFSPDSSMIILLESHPQQFLEQVIHSKFRQQMLIWINNETSYYSFLLQLLCTKHF